MFFFIPMNKRQTEAFAIIFPIVCITGICYEYYSYNREFLYDSLKETRLSSNGLLEYQSIYHQYVYQGKCYLKSKRDLDDFNRNSSFLRMIRDLETKKRNVTYQNHLLTISNNCFNISDKDVLRNINNVDCNKLRDIDNIIFVYREVDKQTRENNKLKSFYDGYIIEIFEPKYKKLDHNFIVMFKSKNCLFDDKTEVVVLEKTKIENSLGLYYGYSHMEKYSELNEEIKAKLKNMSIKFQKEHWNIIKQQENEKYSF